MPSANNFPYVFVRIHNNSTSKSPFTGMDNKTKTKTNVNHKCKYEIKIMHSEWNGSKTENRKQINRQTNEQTNERVNRQINNGFVSHTIRANMRSIVTFQCDNFMVEIPNENIVYKNAHTSMLLSKIIHISIYTRDFHGSKWEMQFRNFSPWKSVIVLL